MGGPFFCGFYRADNLALTDHAHMEEIRNLHCTYAEIAKSDSHREAVTTPTTSDISREKINEQEAELAKENNPVILSDQIGETIDGNSFVEEIATDLQTELTFDEVTCTKIV